jgi:hypothetical protein
VASVRTGFREKEREKISAQIRIDFTLTHLEPDEIESVTFARKKGRLSR